MQRTASSGAWWLNPSAAAVASLPPAVVAVFICVHQLTLHGVLHGIVIGNESQNLGSAIALTNGALPYANFPLASPPGMTILMLPFAGLSHAVAPSVAMSLARGATAATTVVAVYLAGFVARFYGIPASILAGVFTATYPVEFLSTAGVTTGPYVLAFSLLGLALAFPEGRLAEGRRMLYAGLCLGFACTIRPWAIIPTLVVLGCAAAASARRSRLAPAIGGVLAGIVVPSVIFLADAPGAFWRDVVTTELPGHGTMAAGAKLATVLGLGGAAGVSHPDGLAVTLAVIVMVAILLVALASASYSSAYDWCITITSIAVVAVAFLPGVMSPQYGEFAFPLAGIGVGVSASRLLSLMAASGSGAGSDMRATLARGVAVVLVACGVVVAAVAAPADGAFGARYADEHGFIDTGAVTARIPPGACAISNDAMVLIASNRFAANGATCPAAVDTNGLSAIEGDSRSGLLAASNVWLSWLSQARYVAISSAGGSVSPTRIVFTDLHANYVPIFSRAHLELVKRSR
ncbi:MAG TPA: hypothetical protein VKU92_04045 [Acidimicrobiales bacterium]|nr:hypothetical protein [Acidimicrobiales bacterium]